MQRRQGPGSRQLTDGLPARRTGPQYSATLARRSGSVLAKAKMGGGGGGGGVGLGWAGLGVPDRPARRSASSGWIWCARTATVRDRLR